MTSTITINIYGTTSDDDNEDHQVPGGFAAIINAGDTEYRIAGGAPRTDIGDMTMTAAAKALRAVKWTAESKSAKVELHTDFSFMVDLFHSAPPIRHNCLLPIWQEILREAAPLDVKFVKCRQTSEPCRILAKSQITIAQNSKGPYHYYARN